MSPPSQPHPPPPSAPSWRTLALLALAVFALWWPLVTLWQQPISGLQERAADWVWQQSADRTTERRVVLIDIDQASLRALGPWPWSRPQLAQLSDALAQQGAALQVFDIVLAAPAEGDAELAATLARNQAVLAQVFALSPNTDVASGQTTGALAGLACPPGVPTALGHLANPAAYAALPVGHITPQLAPDGLLRHQPALICHQGRAYPALFLAALMHASGAQPLHWAPQSGHPSAPSVRLQGLDIGSAAGLPLSPSGLVRIPWGTHPDAFISLPAHDVLAGRVPHGLLHNAWVVVGSTAIHLGDRVATPFGAHGAGLMVHAQLLRAALDDAIPHQPAWATAYGALWVALGFALMALLMRRRALGAAVLPLLALGWAGAAWGLHALALVHLGWWLPWLAWALLLLGLGLALAAWGYAVQRLERARLLRHLGSYLPAPVAAALLAHDPTDRIEARRLEVSVLYADIRNFSAYCERRPAAESTAVLQAFFAAATRAVEQHGGRVEAFEQDAVLAVFEPSPSQSAAACAQAALAAAEALLAQSPHIFPTERAQQTSPDTPDDDQPLDQPIDPVAAAHSAPLALGIGIDSGEAVLGSFGLAQRRTHRAMGPVVSRAHRLQGMTAELAHPILLGAQASALVGPQRLDYLGSFLLEGLRQPIGIYAHRLAGGLGALPACPTA